MMPSGPAAFAPREVPPGLAQPLSWVGLPWPAGDSKALRDSAVAWAGFARSIVARRVAADSTAGHVGRVNEGQMIDAHRGSWSAPQGPAANLARTVTAARMTAIALASMAVQVEVVKRAYIASLERLVSHARAGGLLLPDGRGGYAIDARGQNLVHDTRAAMVAARGRAIATTTGTIRPLLERSRDSLILVRRPPAARPGQRLYPYTRDPGPGGRNVPRPLQELKDILDQRVDQRVRDRNRQCPARSSLNLPNFPFVTGRGTDPRTFPWMGHVFDIDRRVGVDYATTSTVTGLITDQTTDRVNYQNWMQNLKPYIELPMKGSSEAYDASHLWGRILGTEVAEGIAWAPADINQGVHKKMEEEMRAFARQAEANGGYVFGRAQMTTFGAYSWPEGPLGDGRHFARSFDYWAVECRADGTTGPTRHYGYTLTPPSGSVSAGTFRAGTLVDLDSPPGSKVDWPKLHRLP